MTMSLGRSARCASSRGSVLLLVALSLLLAANAGHGQGKGHGVEVRAVSGGLPEAAPGQVVSLSLRVTSNTASDQELIESLTLPTDWQAIIPLGVFTLHPAETQVRIVAFSLPNTAAAARYEVTYSVRSQSDYGVQDAEAVAVTVMRLSKLAILPEEKPEAVIAGQEYRVKLRFVNQGNAGVAIRPQVTSDRDYPAELDANEFALDAGRDRVATLSVKTDRNEKRMRQHTVEVRALDAGSGKLQAAVAITVNVVPRISGSPDLYHRLPVHLTLRATGGGGTAGLQPELSGSGTLDEAGNHKLEFLFSGPDTHDAGVFGRRDEYRLNYRTSDLDLLLGDQGYGLSPLTERFRYGRGTAVDAGASHDLGFGAYYLQSRWEWPPEEQVGAYVKKSFRDNWLKVNALHKERGATENGPGLDGVLWSLEGELHPADALSLSAEYGRSNFQDRRSVSDDAYRVEVEGGRGESRYELSKIHAGPDYQGYYRDCDQTSGAVVFPVGRGTEARAAYTHWEQNLEQRPDQATAPRERLVQLNVSRRLESRWYLSVGYDDFRGRDSTRLAPCDYEERVLQVSAGRSSDTYNWHLELRGGRREDALAHRSDELRCLSVFAAYRPSPRGSFTLYGSAGDSNARASRLLGFGNNLGATATLQARDDLRVRFGYVRYGFNSDNRAANSMIDAEATYGQPDAAAWTFRVLRNSQLASARDETSYLLSYTVPFGIPVSRKKSVGAISGAVYYEANGTRTPIADAIVTVDGAGAATGRNGRFGLNGLAPGAYFLRLDKASIGPDRVTKDKCPVLAQVKGGETTQLDVAVVQGASVTGQVVTAGPAGNDSLNGSAPTEGSGRYIAGEPLNGTGPGQGAGLPNVLVELTSGDDVLRTVTDQNGSFLFEALRPGRWRLHVYDYNLPAFHYLEKNEADLELTAGESKRMLIRALPRLRRIKMIDDGKAELSIQGQ